MTLFDGIYPFYPQQRKSFVFDVSTIIVVIVFLMLASTFLLIIPGIRGRVVRDPSPRDKHPPSAFGMPG